MNFRTFTLEVILAIVKQFTGQLPEPVNVRLGRKVSSFTTLAAVLHIAFLIAFGNIAEACIKQIPRSKLLEPLIELALAAFADLDHCTL